METDNFGIAKVIAALVQCHDKLTEALNGAQLAKNSKLFGKIYEKQNEIREMLSGLIKE